MDLSGIDHAVTRVNTETLPAVEALAERRIEQLLAGGNALADRLEDILERVAGLQIVLPPKKGTP